MTVLDSEAVVLRQYSLSEADRIVVFVTREYGIVRAVAKGAKRMKSRLGASLEPLNQVQLQFQRKESADLAQIWQCETLHSYLGRNPSLEQVYGFTYFAELVHELVQENNPNIFIYRLFLASLNAGEKIGITPLLIRYFELWILKLSGLLPDYRYCSHCGKCVKEDGFYAWLEAGQVRCRACCQNRGMSVGPGAAKLLQLMLELPPDRFVAEGASRSAAKELERLAHSLLDINLEKRLKSSIPLMKLLQEP